MSWEEYWPKVDSIYGWLSEPEAKRLYDLALGLYYGHVVELGAFMGRSTAAMAFALKHRYSCYHVISVDTWVGTKDGAPEEEIHADLLRQHGVTDLYSLHQKNLSSVGLDGWSRRIRGKTVPHGVEWARDWQIAVGLLFIDADHRYEAVKADFENWSPLVIPEGFVAFHDSWAPGPSQVIAEMPPEFLRVEGAGDMAVFQKKKA